MTEELEEFSNELPIPYTGVGAEKHRQYENLNNWLESRGYRYGKDYTFAWKDTAFYAADEILCNDTIAIYLKLAFPAVLCYRKEEDWYSFDLRPIIHDHQQVKKIMEYLKFECGYAIGRDYALKWDRDTSMFNPTLVLFRDEKMLTLLKLKFGI